MKIPLAIK
jgi:hypothetical protein